MAKPKEEARAYSIVSVAHKTVATFAKITDRPLFLKHATSRDGNVIGVPFNTPDFYRKVELHLAHVLFKTDDSLSGQFIAVFSSAVLKQVERKTGEKLSPEPIKALISAIVQLLDTYRVLSLWEDLYIGSAFEIRDVLARRYTKTNGLIAFAANVMFAPPPPQPDLSPHSLNDLGFEPLRPVFLEAVSMVEKRGFDAVLLTTKWVFTKLVDILASKQPAGDNPRERAVSALSAVVAISALSGFDPPADRAARFSSKDPLPVAVGSLPADLAGALDASKEDMKSVLQRARAMTASGPVSPEDWLRRDVPASVVVVDIPTPPKSPVAASEAAMVERLRALFIRVLGRRHNVLEDIGEFIDVPALIEQRLTGIPGPVFRTTAPGRGFRALVLLDRSASMRGARTDAATRAARLLVRAMDFPFVTLDVWGFQSKFGGEVNLTRYGRGTDSFESSMALLGGVTPLHLAVQLATRELHKSQDYKHLIVVSDGQPVWGTPNGTYIGRKLLQKSVQSEVRAARTKGIDVTGVFVGHDDELTDADVEFMFGPRRWWSRVSDSSMDAQLVELFVRSLTTYLKK